MGLDRNSVDGRDIAPKSVDTDDATYNNSVTYPDGTTVTTSPGGGLQLIQTNTPSGVSETVFTGLDSTYARHTVEITDVVPATDTAALQLQVSNDGGSTWQSGASAYSYAYRSENVTGGTTLRSSSGASALELAASIGNAAGEGGEFTVSLSDPSNTSIVQFIHFSGMVKLGNAQAENNQGGGAYETAEAIDAIRFKFSSGNISSGTFSLYGVKK